MFAKRFVLLTNSFLSIFAFCTYFPPVLSDKRLELERGATFYRERRLATKSPLGENANRPEEIMDDITRGALNNPSMAQSSRNPQDNLGRTITENIAEEKKRGGVVGFFRRRFKRGNN